MKKHLTLFMLSCLSFYSASAFPAPPASLQQQKGFYFGIQYLPGVLIVGTDNIGSHNVHAAYGISPLSLGINFGYQFNRNIAIEAGSQNAILLGCIFAPYVAAKGILPLGQRFNFYAKGGVGALLGTTNTISPFADVGFGVYLSRKTELTMDQSAYYLPRLKSAVGFTGLGLSFHF